MKLTPRRGRSEDAGIYGAIWPSLAKRLDQLAGSAVPGLQYVVVRAGGAVFEYAGGWSDMRSQRPMTAATTLMAYSMTKTFTAAAILQLVEQGLLALDQAIDAYLSDAPYPGQGITIRQLLDHTSGIPNPIPLRWVHLAADHSTFNEPAALARVLRCYPKLRSEPGRRFAYSNIGYWLLGSIAEQVSQQAYADYVRARILGPLGLSRHDMDFVVPDPARHACGYLGRYSLMNLLKGAVTDRRLWGDYDGSWLRLRSHYVNGPAFGGLVGTGSAFGKFLQDQLQSKSALLASATRRLFETRQANREGVPIPMTLGWHVGQVRGETYLFKQGGGGGFRSEMRLYPRTGIGSVVMANSSQFNSSKFLNQIDLPTFRDDRSARPEG
jgi:CubicO group peptidase (beta-lactamase class C family)